MSVITDLLSGKCIDKENTNSKNMIDCETTDLSDESVGKRRNLEDMTDAELKVRGYHRVSWRCEYCTESYCHFCDDVEYDIVPLPHVKWSTVKR